MRTGRHRLPNLPPFVTLNGPSSHRLQDDKVRRLSDRGRGKEEAGKPGGEPAGILTRSAQREPKRSDLEKETAWWRATAVEQHLVFPAGRQLPGQCRSNVPNGK